MRLKILTSALLCLGLLNIECWAQTYPSGVESVVTGTAGVVSGADQLNALGRSTDRLHALRTSLARRLEANFDGKAKFRLDDLNTGAVLCNVRGDHAARAADRSYLATVASQITVVATPGEIKTLFDAIGVIFKHYSIEVISSNNPANSKTAVINRCKDDIPRFATSLYGPSSAADLADSKASLDINNAEVQDIFSSLSALHDAINTIVSPLARAWDRWQRERTITYFLLKDAPRIKAAALRVATVSANFANSRKLRALGQYSEGMATIRTAEIDLSQIEYCKSIANGSAPFESVEDPKDKKKKLRVPSDQFMSCYAAIWRKLADHVSATLKMADDYDQLADAINGDEVKKAKSLGEKLDKLHDPELDLKALWEDAVRLVAFGKMLEEAFSKEHRDKVKSAIDALVKSL